MGIKFLVVVFSSLLGSLIYAETAYVTNLLSPPGPLNEVYSFAVPAMGAVPPPPIKILSQNISRIFGIVVTPDGSKVYIINVLGQIFVLDGDGSTTSTLFTTIPLGVNEGTASIAISPDGNTLYVIVLHIPGVNPGKIISFPIATPAVQTVRAIIPVGINLLGISIDTTGSTGYLIQNNIPYDLFSFSTSAVSGSLTTIPVVPALNKPRGIATIDATNLVVVQGLDVLKVPTAGGASTTIGQFTGLGNFIGVAVGLDKQNVYAVNQATKEIYKFPVNGVLDPGTLVATILDRPLGYITIGPTAVPPGPPTGLLPPSNLQGSSHKTGVLSKDVFYNQLEWDVPSGGGVPTTGYRVYRNGILIVELSPETFSWIDLNTPQGAGTTTTYSVVSVAGSSLSTPISVSVTRVP